MLGSGKPTLLPKAEAGAVLQSPTIGNCMLGYGTIWYSTTWPKGRLWVHGAPAVAKGLGGRSTKPCAMGCAVQYLTCHW